MQFDREKLKAAILYACRRCGPNRLGAVKLHKVLYYSDMLRYVQSGRSITGSTYRKRPLGPTCDQLLGTLKDLQRIGQLRIEEVNYFGFLKKQYIALAEADISRLSNEDVALLDEVIDFVCDQNTARTISELSHTKAWELAEYGDELPYTSAFRLLPTQVSEDSFEWASEQESLVAAIESNKGTMGVVPFGALRARILKSLEANSSVVEFLDDLERWLKADPYSCGGRHLGFRNRHCMVWDSPSLARLPSIRVFF